MRCNMNKVVPWLIMAVILLSSIFICIILTDEGNVQREFEWWIADEALHGQRWLHSKDWCSVYDMSEGDISNNLRSSFSAQQYTGWKAFKKRVNWGWGIDGLKDEVYVNKKLGSTDYDQIAIYINKTRRLAFLVYGRTYGQ